MTLDARLNQLLPALTAKERALLVLRSLREKTPQDPSWRSTVPANQTTEFNRLIVLMNACNIYLPLYITMVEQSTEQLYVRFLWWHSVLAMGQETWKLAQFIPAAKRAQAATAVKDYWPVAELPWEPETDQFSWLNVCDKMEAGIRLWLVSLWQELRSIDIVLEEVAREFDGEDPLRPVMRGIVEKTRKKLSDLHAMLSALQPLELSEPDEESVELARAYFENGRRLMAGL